MNDTKLKKIRKDIDSIEYGVDLQKRSLTLSDYQIAKLVWNELYLYGKSTIIQRSVANYYGSFGISFSINKNGYYDITLNNDVINLKKEGK